MSNMVVQTNVMAINSHRSLGLVGNAQARSSARLSSGFRINSAADDAAGLAISEKMRAQIRGLDQASRNGQDGISLIQTAEGAMSIVNDMVIRIRELVVQAANDTNAHDGDNLAQSDRIQIQREINALMAEIDDITLRTEFNTRTLLDGTLSGDGAGGVVLADAARATAFELVNDFREAINDAVVGIWAVDEDDAWGDVLSDLSMVGLSPSEIIEIQRDLEGALRDFEAGVVSARSLAEAQLARDALDTALRTLRDVFVADFEDRLMGVTDLGMGNANWVGIVGNGNAGFGATEIGFFSAAHGTAWDIALGAAFTTLHNRRNLATTIIGADGLPTAGPGTGNAFDRFGAAGDGLWFHIGANAGQGVTLNIEAVNVTQLDRVGRNQTALTVSRETLSAVNAGFGFARLRNNELIHNRGIMLAEGEDINQFINGIDAALAHVAGQRAVLGATQNRLEFTIENLDIASENLSAANSRIRDADMAQEMMRFTQSNVLQQAAISMLAQANQAPQSILQLLR